MSVRKYMILSKKTTTTSYDAGISYRRNPIFLPKSFQNPSKVHPTKNPILAKTAFFAHFSA